MTIEEAVAAHVRFKLRLYKRLEGGTPPEIKDVGESGRCELGRLLEAGHPNGRALTSRRLARDAHELFHIRAAEVVAACRRSGVGIAVRMMEEGSPFAAASLAVVAALTRLAAETRREEERAKQAVFPSGVAIGAPCVAREPI